MEPSQPLTVKELRSFGFTTGAIACALFGLVLPLLFGHGFPLWPWYLAGVLFVLAVVYPPALRPVYRGWMKIGHVLGFINTRIILGILFYGLIFPMGVGMRLFRKDPMGRSLDEDLKSYRIASRVLPKQHMERPF